MKKDFSQVSIAIIYDHLLTEYGGAEQVLDALLETFPQAELFAAIHDRKISHWADITQLHTSGLQNYFALVQQREILDLLTPISLEQLNFKNFDIIISVTSSAAKGVITLPHQLHICYLLTPTRYLYHTSQQLLSEHTLLSLPLISWFTQKILAYLRWWDQAAVWRPDKIIAISQQVAERSKEFYQRSVDEIIYPPVQIAAPQTEELQNSGALTNLSYLLCISRLVPYKRIDLAIAAAQKLDRVLCIAGNGRELHKLVKIAGANSYRRSKHENLEHAIHQARTLNKSIIFLNSCTNLEKQQLLRQCSMVIMPGIEDFGIVALEANAYGKPIVIAQESGVAEVIHDGKEGIHFPNQNLTNLVAAIKKAEKTKFSTQQLKANAHRFSRGEFVRKFHNKVFAFYKEHSTINQ